MARVILSAPFDTEFFGGRTEMEVAATHLFALVDRLDAIGPGFAAIATVRAALAVDGVMAHDWSSPIVADSEVLVVPRIAGG